MSYFDRRAQRDWAAYQHALFKYIGLGCCGSAGDGNRKVVRHYLRTHPPTDVWRHSDAAHSSTWIGKELNDRLYRLLHEIGGVLGVAVLATVFTSTGDFGSPQAYVDGLIPAVWVGAGVLAVGAVVALLVPGRRAAAPAVAIAPAHDAQPSAAIAA